MFDSEGAHAHATVAGTVVAPNRVSRYSHVGHHQFDRVLHVRAAASAVCIARSHENSPWCARASYVRLNR